jgi:predicted GNAT superfamily acetyltransferase
MPDSSIHIRTLASLEDYEQAEAVQRDAWNMRDDGSQIVPLHVLLTAQKNGGLVAGAFDSNNHMVGMLFGFIGLTPEGKYKHCSHIMGVRRNLTRQNIGLLLKRFQREYVMAQGIDLITWTYDPLEGVNASLNIARLGAVTNHYYHNLYGHSMADSLNAGLPTDRFEVDWWLHSEHVQEHYARPERPSHKAFLASGATLINQTKLDESGALHPIDTQLSASTETVLFEVPAEFQAVKMFSLELALEWRRLTAEVFDHYFAQGYAVTDYLTDRDSGFRRNFYVMTPLSKLR